MKKRLLKPPSEHGEILFLPGVEKFSEALQGGDMLSTCHQLQFFHPGIGIRFHLVDLVQREEKCVIFMDTDRTNIRVRVPCVGKKHTHGRGIHVGLPPKVFDFVVSEKPLYTFSSLDSGRVHRFFKEVACQLEKDFGDTDCDPMQEFQRFSQIFLGQDHLLPLRERLADAFIRFNGMKTKHMFLSELLADEEYSEFIRRIFMEAERFRAVYNQSIDRFSDLFRFRFKNYPFPKLREGEIPFWIIRDHRRYQLSTNSVDLSDVRRYTTVPKASPLTLFLRLHVAGVFMHGVGGANYEWINDKILERFYHVHPSPFFTMSATFHLCTVPDRDYAYFFMNPTLLRNALKSYFKNRGSAVIS